MNSNVAGGSTTLALDPSLTTARKGKTSARQVGKYHRLLGAELLIGHEAVGNKLVRILKRYDLPRLAASKFIGVALYVTRLHRMAHLTVLRNAVE